jgi:hypothetical protein
MCLSEIAAFTSCPIQSYADFKAKVKSSMYSLQRALIRLSHLAPEFAGALLAGRHPIELTPIRLLRLSKNLPQLGDDLVSDFLIKARPVLAGTRASGVSGHRGSPRRAPRAFLATPNPSRPTRPISHSKLAPTGVAAADWTSALVGRGYATCGRRHAAERHHAMRSWRDALASRSNRSPWHAAGAQKQSRSLPRSSSNAPSKRC